MLDQIRHILALARLIIVDGLRRHAMIGLILFAMTGATSGILFFHFIPRDIGRAANDFLFSITWLTGFIFLLFHGVYVMAWDNERGALHTFMARPISRAEYALSLFTGMAALLMLLNIILGSLNWLILHFIQQSVGASHFQYLSLSSFLVASTGLYWIHLMILAVILLFSSMVRGSFPVLILTLCYYFICSGLPVVRESLSEETGAGVSPMQTILLKYLTAVFPDFSWLDFKTLVASSDPAPAAMQLMIPFALSTLYIVIVLWLACIVYERRDLQ